MKHLTWSDTGLAVCAAHKVEVCGRCGLDFALANALARGHKPGDTLEAQGDGWKRMEVGTRAYFAEPAPEQKMRPAGAGPCAEVDTLSLALLSLTLTLSHSRTLTLSSLSHPLTLTFSQHTLSLI
jgi:hypothetical protein